jgi:hypothetical protein
MSSGVALAAAATRIVCARSAAEMPVVTPCAASIDTVKLVPCADRFTAVIGARFSCRARASVIGMQTRPRPKRAMKLIASAVTQSAASTRSPSFSRSSSSTSTTIRPAFISAMISTIGAIGIRCSLDQANDILPQHPSCARPRTNGQVRGPKSAIVARVSALAGSV